MTRTTNARVAGFAFLVYIAAGIGSMILFSQAGADSVTAKLANIAQHLLQVRINLLLGLVETVCAFVLAATLYSITRDEDSDLALMGLMFRMGEGLLGAFAIRETAQKLWLATASGREAPDAATVQAIGTYLLNVPGGANLGAILFALGSTLFSYLLMRGRMIPAAMAWLGVVASVLLAVGLPLQFAGFLKGPLVAYVWFAMAAYEIPLGFWLIIKGARPSASLAVR